jgi:hypothetical protein
MASRSQIYPLARQLFAQGSLDWATANVKAALIAAGYTPDFTQQFLSGIPASAVLATTANIAGKTGNAGYLDGNTTSFGIVGAGTAGYILFYQDTGSPATSTLILFLDTPDIPGMPQVLQGLQYFIYQNLTFGGWARL